MAGRRVPKEELDKFETFLIEMDEVVDQFVADADAAGHPLNFSIDSLSELEGFLAHRLATANDDELEQLLNRAARYFGESFRRKFGGKWELCLKNPRYLYYRLPVISGYSESDIEFCPLEVLRNFAHKQETGMLRKACEAHSEFAQ